MKPGFALDLRQETIRLLHRTRRGWLEVGNANLDAPDLGDELAVLRRTALGLSPSGIATKLILPESQLLFTEVPVRSAVRGDQHREIGLTLEGMTPYALDDLVFDWSATGQQGVVSVAAVARVTLAEAEDFAVAHGFNPVSFVAHPGQRTFAGEPFFGAASHAARLLAKGEQVERDSEPVEIVTALPDGRAGRPVPDGTGTDTQEGLRPSDEPPPLRDEAEIPGEVVTEGLPETVARDLRKADDGTTREPASGDDGASDLPGETGDAADDTRRAAEDAAGPAAHGAGGEAEAAVDEAPFIALGDIPEFDGEPGEELPSVAFVSSRAPEDPGSDAGLPQRLLSPAARFRPFGDGEAGGGGGQVTEAGQAEALPRVTLGSVVDDDDDPGDTDALVARTGAVRAPRPVRAPVPEAVHGTAAQRRMSQDAGQAPHAPPHTPLGSATRGLPPEAAGVGQSAGRMRLAIVGAIVLLLVALAVLVWVVGLSSEGDGSASLAPGAVPVDASPAPGGDDAPNATAAAGPADTQDAAAAPTLPVDPDADQTALAAEESAEPAAGLPADDGTEAALAEALGVAGALDDPSAGLPADPAKMPVAAPTAADGQPPSIAAAPGASSADPVAEETMPEPDAAGAPALTMVPAAQSPAAGQSALPVPSADPGDAAPAAPLAPPPYGTVYEYGADGLILPTPEGVILPGRVTLYAGRPPVVPKPRPGSALPAAPEPAPGTDPGPDDASLNDPAAQEAAALAESGAASDVPPPVDPAHAAKKPKARPASVVALAERRRAEAEKAAAAAAAAAEAMAKASTLAVASSRRPAARPDDLARSVAAAVAAAAPAIADPQPEATASAAPSAEVDEPEPVSAMPNIPTTVTVSRQATVKNALKLGDTNLIGVFGSSSSRRALIRMSNGRMIKLKVGDTFDGGKVAAIGDSTLSYVKNGKTYTLNIQ
ncbi:MAG: hypothetical protein KDE03_13270 [Rhodobacteraceae bacterium]|nr:hypothetical protein [Paracoccaceae bacterium]